MRDSVVFYKSYKNSIDRLPTNDEKLKAYEAIFNYGLDDKEPTDDGLFMIVFEVVREQIDACNQRYFAAVENGRKGGLAKASKAKTKFYLNDNVNEKDNDNINVNEKEETVHLFTTKVANK